MNRASITMGDGPPQDLLTVDKADYFAYASALGRLTRALGNAKKALHAVGVDEAVLSQRESEAATLLDGLKTDSPILGVGMPAAWSPTLRAALALEWDAVNKLAEAEIDLLSETCKETNVRRQYVTRLLDELDLAVMGGPS